MKVCSICKESKLLSDYYRTDWKKKDGSYSLKAHCKSCELKRVAVWRKENPDCRKKEWANKKNTMSLEERIKKNMRESVRRASTSQAVPVWANQEEILYVYQLAQERGLSVDHIVPLQSNKVCGLHTEDNLRCIPKKLNTQKGNRYWPDMWEDK